MNKYKIILMLILLPIIFTGCNTSYKIIVNEDLSSKEKISFEVNNLDEYREFNNFETNNDLIDYFYSQLEPYIKEENYNSTKTLNENTLNVFIEKSNTNFDLNNSMLSKVYKYFDSYCNEKVCSIIATADEDLEEGDGMFPNLKIEITVPFKVLEHNADEIDLKNNTFIWYYSLSGKRSNINLFFEKEGRNVIVINKTTGNIMLIVYIVIGAIVVGFVGYIIHRIIKNSRPSF